MSVFVLHMKGLPKEVTREDIHLLMEDCEPIDEVKIFDDRIKPPHYLKYGFVYFPTKEGMQKGLAHDGDMMYTRRITCSVSTSSSSPASGDLVCETKTSSHSSHDRERYSIYISGVPKDTPQMKIAELFRGIGNVLYVSKPDGSSVFVDFSDLKSVINILELARHAPFTIEGRRLMVDVANSTVRKLAPKSSDLPGQGLVDKVPAKSCEATVEDLRTQLGCLDVAVNATRTLDYVIRSREYPQSQRKCDLLTALRTANRKSSLNESENLESPVSSENKSARQEADEDSDDSYIGPFPVTRHIPVYSAFDQDDERRQGLLFGRRYEDEVDSEDEYLHYMCAEMRAAKIEEGMMRVVERRAAARDSDAAFPALKVAEEYGELEDSEGDLFGRRSAPPDLGEVPGQGRGDGISRGLSLGRGLRKPVTEIKKAPTFGRGKRIL